MIPKFTLLAMRGQELPGAGRTHAAAAAAHAHAPPHPPSPSLTLSLTHTHAAPAPAPPPPPAAVHGDGLAVRSYLYVEDVAAAFDTVLHKGLLGEVYNIGTQIERSVTSVARDIAAATGLPEGRIVHVRDRAFNDR